MSVRFYADSSRVAIYEEAPGGGDPLEPGSSMNRPILDPIGWISNIFFHSDLNYYGIAAKNLNAVVNHPAIGGLVRNAGDNDGDAGSSEVSINGQGVVNTHSLITHNLGYVPRFFCIYDNRLVPQGIPVQSQDNSRARFVTAYATPNEIRLFDLGWSSNLTLDATTKTYQVIVFRTPAKDASLPMLEMNPGSVIFGQGKFRFTEPHLRVSGAGDTNFAIAMGKTAAIKNGGVRAYTPNGSYIDFGPYNGGLSSPPFINVSAGV